jgi:Tol biopolymer transport system component
MIKATRSALFRRPEDGQRVRCRVAQLTYKARGVVQRSRRSVKLAVVSSIAVVGVGPSLATASKPAAIIATPGLSVAAKGPLAAVATRPHNGRIVFQANVRRFPQLFTIEPDGSRLRRLTHVAAKDPGAENPAWSPDGKTIAFDTAAGKGVNIFTLTPGGTAMPLPLGVGAFNGDPAYSPDGTQISFDQDIGSSQPTVHGIFIANADGGNAHRLTTGIPTRAAFDTESQWSPDGKRLVFTRVKNSKQAAIFIVNIDGSELRRITPWNLDAASADWSPNGRRILFNSYFDFHPGKSSNIYSIRADGSHRALLTHTANGVQSFRPSWSPDGTRIVFTRFTPTGRRTGRTDLYTMNPQGKRLRRVTNLPQAFPTNPDWGTLP